MFDLPAIDISRRVAAEASGPVLEIGCGHGLVTQHLRRRLAPEIRLVATDVDEWLLACAKLRLKDTAGIAWRQADAAALPFPDASFAAVACQFGPIAPGTDAAFRQIHRVLKAGGPIAFTYQDVPLSRAFGSLAIEALADLRLPGPIAGDADLRCAESPLIGQQLDAFVDLDIHPTPAGPAAKPTPSQSIVVTARKPWHDPAATRAHEHCA